MAPLSPGGGKSCSNGGRLMEQPKLDPRNRGTARLLTPCKGCLEVVYEGRVDGNIVEGSVDDLRGMLSDQPAQYLMVDGSGISDYDMSVRDQGRELMQVFRDAGGKEVVMVLSSAVHRLLGATVAMMVRLPIKIFANRTEALRYVHTKLDRA
jgi:hypothetical protein